MPTSPSRRDPSPEELVAIVAAVEMAWPPAGGGRGRREPGLALALLEPVVDTAPVAGQREGPALAVDEAEPEVTTVGDDFAVVFRGGDPTRPALDWRPTSSAPTRYTYDGVSFTTLARPGGERSRHRGHGQRRPLRRDGLRLRVEHARRRSDVREPAGRAAVSGDHELGRRRGDRRRRSGRGARQGRPHRRRHRRGVPGLPPLLRGRLRRSDAPHPRQPRRLQRPDRRPLRALRRGGAGAVLAMLDTTVPFAPNGGVDDGQLEWLDELAAGHLGAGPRSSGTTTRGHPAPSTAATPTSGSIRTTRRSRSPSPPGDPPSPATSAGTPTATGSGASPPPGRSPWVEVACVKDFPGAVGRVPDLRGRDPPARPPHPSGRRPRLDGADPGHVRRPVPRLRLRLDRRSVLRGAAPGLAALRHQQGCPQGLSSPFP